MAGSFLKHTFMRGKYGESKWKEADGTFFEQKAKLKGVEGDLKTLSGKVLLVTNVASQCGYTDGSYKGMVALHNKLADRGFQVVAFPCSQFANQEPGDEATVCSFAANKYGAKFQIMSKIDVNGTNTAPIYQFLKKSFPGDITWNFSSKFVINRQGVPVKRFEKESWETIEKYVTDLLSEPIPAGSAAAAEVKTGATPATDASATTATVAATGTATPAATTEATATPAVAATPAATPAAAATT